MNWIIAATGPSMTPDVAKKCVTAQLSGWKIAAVNDAYKLLPSSDILYACDVAWWNVHKGCQDFSGEKWSSISDKNSGDKKSAALKYRLKLIRGIHGDGFSSSPDKIHYGSNSGFQTINLVINLGAQLIVLVGYDMRSVNGKRHFFGNHPAPLSNMSRFESFVCKFDTAAKTLPPRVRIINATPGSAIKCFPMVDLDQTLGLMQNA